MDSLSLFFIKDCCLMQWWGSEEKNSLYPDLTIIKSIYFYIRYVGMKFVYKPLVIRVIDFGVNILPQMKIIFLIRWLWWIWLRWRKKIPEPHPAGKNPRIIPDPGSGPSPLVSSQIAHLTSMNRLYKCFDVHTITTKKSGEKRLAKSMISAQN